MQKHYISIHYAVETKDKGERDGKENNGYRELRQLFRFWVDVPNVCKMSKKVVFVLLCIAVLGAFVACDSVMVGKDHVGYTEYPVLLGGGRLPIVSEYRLYHTRGKVFYCKDPFLKIEHTLAQNGYPVRTWCGSLLVRNNSDTVCITPCVQKVGRRKFNYFLDSMMFNVLVARPQTAEGFNQAYDLYGHITLPSVLLGAAAPNAKDGPLELGVEWPIVGSLQNYIDYLTFAEIAYTMPSPSEICYTHDCVNNHYSLVLEPISEEFPSYIKAYPSTELIHNIVTVTVNFDRQTLCITAEAQ